MLCERRRIQRLEHMECDLAHVIILVTDPTNQGAGVLRECLRPHIDQYRLDDPDRKLGDRPDVLVLLFIAGIIAGIEPCVDHFGGVLRERLRRHRRDPGQCFFAQVVGRALEDEIGELAERTRAVLDPFGRRAAPPISHPPDLAVELGTLLQRIVICGRDAIRSTDVRPRVSHLAV